MSSTGQEDPELGIELESATGDEPSLYQSAATSVNEATDTSSEQSESWRGSTDSQVLTQQELDKKPWKYIGYKGYSEFLASDNDFQIFRRFGAASTRIALGLQDRVAVLEEELARCDRKYSRRAADDVHNGSFRQDQRDREEIFDQLHESLITYNTFMLQQAQIKAHPSPIQRDITNLENWHWNHNITAVTEKEHRYLKYNYDLFSLVPREKSPLRRLFERWARFRHHSFWREQKGGDLPQFDKDIVIYWSNKRIDKFVTAVIVGCGMIMLIAPLWILQALDGTYQKLGTITGFVVGFLAMVSYTTAAKPFETLAATAAYAAVLTVFLQFGGPSNPASS